MTNGPSPAGNRDYLVERFAGLVTSQVQGGRIGTVRFVRWTERADAAREDVQAVIDRALRAVSAWTRGHPLVRMKVENGPARLIHADFPGGASALISVSPASPGSTTGIDLAVLGSSGAIYHDAMHGRRRDLAL